MWKTNFDKSDYSDVLMSHKTRMQGDLAPPTVSDIPPRSHTNKSKTPSSMVRLSLSKHDVLFNVIFILHGKQFSINMEYHIYDIEIG